MSEPGAFNCTSCGLCCKVVKIPALADWDRGDGWCRYLTTDMKCSIYEERPLICRIDDVWEKEKGLVIIHLGVETREEYHQMMYEACRALQDEAKGTAPEPTQTTKDEPDATPGERPSPPR